MMAAVAAMALTGCKPTEKNYRAAYDAALNKRQQTQAALDADGLISEDAPRLRVVQGDSIYLINDVLRPNGVSKLKYMNVVVAKFKMPTNARAGAEALKAKGYDAFAARATGDNWYIVGGAFDTLDSAREFIRRFRKENPSYPYIGIDGHAAVIRE